jgi:hypothetical protein
VTCRAHSPSSPPFDLNYELLCRGATSSSDDNAAEAVGALRRRDVTAAPAVETSGLVLSGREARPASDVSRAPLIATSTLHFNPNVDELYGGERADMGAISNALRNHTGGHVENAGLPSAVFEMQYNAFHARGRAEAPDGTTFGGPEVPGTLLDYPCQCLTRQ